MKTPFKLGFLIIVSIHSLGIAQTDALTILPNGNVGIGTTTPAQKLEVNGNIQSETTFIGNGGWGANYAAFNYKGFGNQKNNYALMHRNDGKTILNASAGMSINFRINNDQKMVLGANGNFGIGTIAPQQKLDVAGNAIINSAFAGDVGFGENWAGFSHKNSVGKNSYGFRHHIYGIISLVNIKSDVNGFIGFRVDDQDKMVIKSNGNVGIGTDSPIQAKLVVSGNTKKGLANKFRYFATATSNFNNWASPSNSHPYSIYASDRIAAVEFNAFSDARIKNILGISNAANDLKMLAKIKITDYTLIDTVTKGNKTHKKVIAQQLKEVFPQAVTDDIIEVIPNIYQLSTINNGWIPLETEELAQGDTIQLIFSSEETLVEVLEIKEGSIKVASDQEGQVFVYGKQVDDFHTVDYEAIAMLNVSATQALLKRIETLSRKQKQLEDHLSASVSRIEKLETLFNNLK